MTFSFASCFGFKSWNFGWTPTPAPMPVSTSASRGNDRLVGTEKNDLIEGMGGNDTIHGLGGDDDLRGQNDNDTLDGGKGNDFLSGASGDDRLIGGFGKDELRGGNGNDILTGDVGDCSPFGGLFGRLFGEADRFHFLESSTRNGVTEQDIITDFQKGIDILDLGDGIDVLKSEMTRGGTVLTLSGGDHDTILLQNVYHFDSGSVC